MPAPSGISNTWVEDLVIGATVLHTRTCLNAVVAKPRTGACQIRPQTDCLGFGTADAKYVLSQLNGIDLANCSCTAPTLLLRLISRCMHGRPPLFCCPRPSGTAARAVSRLGCQDTPATHLITPCSSITVQVYRLQSSIRYGNSNMSHTRTTGQPLQVRIAATAGENPHCGMAAFRWHERCKKCVY